MKLSDENMRALDEALMRINVSLSTNKRSLLLQHLSLLIEKNKTLNLTRIDSMEEAIVLHIEDSLAILPEFMGQDGRFLDIGTGGGFPGIPLAIASERPGVLLDSVKKKAKAVQEFIESLNLSDQLCAVGMRSEELAVEQPGSFTTVVARAVSSLSVVQELATPLIAPQGVLLAMKGSVSTEEENAAYNASQKLGLELVNKRKFTIGSQAEYNRALYMYQKVAEPQFKLPRRPGMAAKRPLG